MQLGLNDKYKWVLKCWNNFHSLSVMEAKKYQITKHIQLNLSKRD